MLRRVRWAFLLPLLVWSSPGFAATDSVAGLANPLENNGIGARALAMGSAFVGVADDPSALYWNPGGLSSLQHTEIELDNNFWLAGINQETAVLTLPLQELGVAAASINYVNYGSLPGYDANGAQTANYSANDYGFGLGWGREIAGGLSGGVTLNGNTQAVGSTNYSNLSLNLGALWHPWEDWSVGLAYDNLGTPVAGYAEAGALRGGASYRIRCDDSNQLLLAASAAWQPQGVNTLQLGAEDRIFRILALRIGYQAGQSDSQIQGTTGLTAGLGLSAEGFNVDYAYLPFGDLGAANWLTLGYKFP